MYLDQCTYKEQYQPVHVYVFTGPCILTGVEHTVTLPAPGLFAYNQGALIQDAFPELSASDREFIISGISPEGWARTMMDKDDIDPTIDD
jgi:hypothetical protein